MGMKIDGKFSCDGERIFNTVSGEAMPEDEPRILLRARDNNALQALTAYSEACLDAGCNDLHMEGIRRIQAAFSVFAVDHQERMKEPGVTRHLKLD
jgi:hypothetical protein